MGIPLNHMDNTQGLVVWACPFQVRRYQRQVTMPMSH